MRTLRSTWRVPYRIFCLFCFCLTLLMSVLEQGQAQSLPQSPSHSAPVATPGGRIHTDNMAQVELLLTPSTRWMLEQGMFMTLMDTKPVRWPHAYTEATQKYSGQVRVSVDGRVLHNYIAGAPFPRIDTNDPLVGYKIMWNFVHNPSFIDNIGTDLHVDLISSQGAVQRTFHAPLATHDVDRPAVY